MWVLKPSPNLNIMGNVREKILLNKINQLKKHIYLTFIQLDNWETRIGIYKTPLINEVLDTVWREICIGSRWEAKDDIVRWFKRKITIPPEFKGQKVVLDIEVGGEGLVYINGKIKSSITSCMSPWEPQRTRILLTEEAKENRELEILIEAGLHYMEFASYRDQGIESIKYEFKKADLCLVDTKAEEFYFDLMVTYDVLRSIQGKSFQGGTTEGLPKNIKEMITSFIKYDKYGSLIHTELVNALEASLLALDFDFSRDRLLSSIDKANQILKDRINKIPYLPQGQMILTGHSHIDTAWLWPIKETIKKCARTFSNTISLMSEYPEHNFAQSQPQLYEYTKKYYPDLYEKIREKIKEGSWELIGNSWVECDTNIPSGESLIRQILYGMNFFKNEFGKWSKIFWMPDVFGYSWALPQIIKRSGMEYFYTAKLNNNDVNRFPYSIFKWQGIDGTKILSYLQRANYNGNIHPDFINEVWDNYDEKGLHKEVLGTYGYGDGGGGPTYEMLEYSKRLEKFPGMITTRLDSAESFFINLAENTDNLPVWNDEMYYEFHRGTYTSQADVKRSNRKSELLYRQGEIASSIALNKFGSNYPVEKFTEGWKLILTNQFHDIIPGSSINEVYAVSKEDYKKIFNIGSIAERNALNTIVANIDFIEGSYKTEVNYGNPCKDADNYTVKNSQRNASPVDCEVDYEVGREDLVHGYMVVFNYLSWPVTGPVEARINLTDFPDLAMDFFYLRDIYDKDVPYTLMEIDSENLLISFEARDIPSIGYSTYKLIKNTRIKNAGEGKEAIDVESNPQNTFNERIADGKIVDGRCITVTEKHMENRFFKIEINASGEISSIYDKKMQRHVLTDRGYGNVFQIFEDRPAVESSWNIDIEYQKKGWIIDEVKSIDVIESSSVKGVLRIVKTFNKSEITQDIIIYPSVPRIDFDTRIDWYETEKLLKAAFEVDILSPYATYEIAFGSIRRPTHRNTSWDKAKFEVPAHKWADLSEGGYGVSILNDCKYGYDIEDNVMRITLLKAPVYPDPVADKGRHRFVYSLYPHDKDWIDSKVVNAGYELNVPLKAVWSGSKDRNISVNDIDEGKTTGNRKNILPVTSSFASIDKNNVIIDSLKAAEDKDGLIMRLYESSGIRGKAKINTVLNVTEVIECDLMEKNEAYIELVNGEIVVDIKPYEIKTLRLRSQ